MDEKILITKASLPPFEEYCEEIRELWDTHWITNMGKKHKEFQESLQGFMNADRIELLVNGHMALEMTLQAMELKGEVITSSFTFASTTHAIVRNRLTPVFCDIDPDTYTIDARKIEELINDKTCAILPVHVYGNICDVESIDRIAKKYGLKVIYDAAHAFAEKFNGKDVGNYGDASCFSFHATKVFNSIEGGAVVYHEESLGKALYELKNFGIHGPEEVAGVGANAKMNEFCASMGICNLRHVEQEIERRQKIDRFYRERLSGIEGLQINDDQKNVKKNYSYFPIIIDKERFGASRNEVFDTLWANDICPRKYFYPLTSTFDAFHGRFDPSETPIALRASECIMTLPLYPDMNKEQVDRICDIILETGERA